jgi:Leucine-rich repeat (LRR) protein
LQVSPAIELLDQLRTLNLAHNKLIRLPREICNLPSLQVFRLEHNSITTLPDAFGSLAALTELDLSHNALNSLPPSIGRLGQLRILSLAHNALKGLPDLGRLGDSLEELDISHNAIECLPPSWAAGLRSLTRACLRAFGGVRAMACAHSTHVFRSLVPARCARCEPLFLPRYSQTPMHIP